MLELLTANPWILMVGLGLLVPITAIICGTVSDHLRKVRQAQLDAGLKHEMIQRGMSAEEICLVIEASPRRKKKHSGDSAADREIPHSAEA